MSSQVWKQTPWCSCGRTKAEKPCPHIVYAATQWQYPPVSQHWVEDTTCWWKLQIKTAGEFVKLDTASVEEKIERFKGKKYTDVDGNWPCLRVPYAPPIRKNEKQSKRTKLAHMKSSGLSMLPPRHDAIGSPVTGSATSSVVPRKVRRKLGGATGSATSHSQPQAHLKSLRKRTKPGESTKLVKASGKRKHHNDSSEYAKRPRKEGNKKAKLARAGD